jgi:hypothetical protein
LGCGWLFAFSKTDQNNLKSVDQLHQNEKLTVLNKKNHAIFDFHSNDGIPNQMTNFQG